MSTKFLIIRLSSIGDIVLTSPVVRCLKNQFQDAEIHFLTKQGYQHILYSNPHISKVHQYKGNMPELLQTLKAENFDWVIDLHNNFRSWRIKSSLRVKYRTVSKYNLRKFLLIRFNIDSLPQSTISQRSLKTLKRLGVTYDGLGLDYFLPNEEIFPQNDLPETFRNGYIAFVIGGTYNTKKLPLDKVSKVCENIDKPVILLGGKEEYGDGEHVLSKSKGNILNLAGKISLNQSASLIREARLVVTNDTGLMHIAAAFKRKILSVWGNTDPRFGFQPFEAADGSMILEIKPLSCRPCSKLGYKRCPKKHFNCMEQIDTGLIVHWINEQF